MIKAISAFFSKNLTKSNAPEDFMGKFRVGRGSGGFAFHVIADNNWEGLCGTAVIERKNVVTPEYIINALPNVHEYMYYCGACTKEFTGLTQEEFTALVRSKKG